MTDFSSAEKDTLTSIMIFGAVCSLAGSLFIIIAFLTIPKLHNFAFRLVFFMAICEFLHALGGALGGSFDDDGNSGTCRFQGFLIQFGSLSSIMWVVVISYCIKQVVINRNAYVEEELWYYHIYVWTSTIILSVLPFSTDSYGPASGWCWISKEDTGIVWRFVSFYVPLWIAGAWILWIYYRTIRQLENSMQVVLNRMKYYPMVLLITYFFATVNRIAQIFTEPIFVLACLHYFFSTLAGFFNCVVYGWTPTVRAEITRCFYNENIEHRLIDFDANNSYHPPSTETKVVSSLDNINENDGV